MQSTTGVQRVQPVEPALVTEMLEELAADMEIAAVHIGMLGSEKVVNAVEDFLEHRGLGNVVLDPILISSSGARLIDEAGVRVMVERLLPIAAVVTPNVDEASRLTALPVKNVEQMRTAAAKLHTMGAAAVVITGGHLDKAIDLLSFTSKRGIEQEIFKSNRQKSTSTHGTGCAFATAITCHLAQGRGLPEAVLLAKAYVSAAIVNAHLIGKGIGPVHHLYRMYQQRRIVIADPEPVL